MGAFGLGNPRPFYDREAYRREKIANDQAVEKQREEMRLRAIAERDNTIGERALREAEGDFGKAAMLAIRAGGSPKLVATFQDQNFQQQKAKSDAQKAQRDALKAQAENQAAFAQGILSHPDPVAAHAAARQQFGEAIPEQFDPVFWQQQKNFGDYAAKNADLLIKQQAEKRAVTKDARDAEQAAATLKHTNAQIEHQNMVNAGNLPQAPTGEQAEFKNFFLPKFKDAHPELPNNAQTELAAFDAYRASKRGGDSQTADIKNWEFYKSQGGKKDFNSWLTEDANRRRPVSTTNVIGGTPENPSSTAQMVADYQIPFTTAVSRLPGPARDALLAQVKAINPNFQASNFDTYKGTERAFTSGKEAASANALNTMMGHLGTLEEATAALNNGDIQALNKIGNAIGVQTGKDPVIAFRTIVNRVGPEVAKAYIGGGGGQEERKKIEEDFNPNASPQQIRTAIRVSAQLAESKVKALQDQYNRGTYGRGKQKLLTDEAEATRQRLSSGGSAGGQQREQFSKSTGQYRHSLDGGKTWQMGRLPK